jgi:hypothetical protein
VPAGPSPSESPAVVTAECRTFARYLSGVDASPYVQAGYARLLPSAAVSPQASARLIERSLLAVARQGELPVRVADVYARFFLPRSALRRRLVLVLAMLENTPVSERPLNSAYEGSLPAVVLHLALTGIASVGCLLVGLVVFGPLHLASGGDASAPPEPGH